MLHKNELRKFQQKQQKSLKGDIIQQHIDT